MIETLHTLMMRRLHPALADLIAHGFTTLRDMGFVNYEFEINNLVNTVEELPPEAWVQGVIAVLDAGLNVVLSEHEVVFEFTDDDLEMKIAAVAAMGVISEFGEPRALLAHTEDETLSKEEAMASILGETTTIDVDDWFMRIVYVAPAMINAIADLMYDLEKLAGGEEEAVEQDEKRIRARTRAKAYRAKADGVELYAMNAISEGVKPGRPVSAYMEYAAEPLIELEKDNALKAAQNVLFAVLLSEVSDSDVLQVTQSLCEETYEVGPMLNAVGGYIISEYQKVDNHVDA